MPCKACEIIPDKVIVSDYVFIKFPIAHTYKKIKDKLSSEAISFNASHNLGLTVSLKGLELDALADIISNTLTPVEKDGAIACFTELPGLPSEIDLLNSTPLNGAVSRLSANWLIDILKEGRILMYYQPIVNKDKVIIGHEALLRAKSQSNELIYPKKIFDLANHSNLLFYLDREARVNAIINAKQNTFNDLKLFINFNPSSIYDPDFCLNTTIKAAKESNFLSSNIVFEIIETERINDYSYVVEIIKQYKKYGFKIALDDVGAGYSSLNAIMLLKPDIVKIDMQLIRNIDSDSVKQVIVQRLVDVCSDLGIVSLAEGVETEAEYQCLKSFNIGYMQGFYFGRPVPN
ncbi:EAL domain-containing protein [Thiotrichales bacterium 19X7-9]|nr:EAL domain-containing protein [Thiotrichales bacterium 19X7-9]